MHREAATESLTENVHPKYYTLTDLERGVMDYLRNIGWYNYMCEPGYSDVAPFEIAESLGITEQQVGGVLTNLIKKHLIDVIDTLQGSDSKYRHIVYSTGWAYVLYGDEKMYQELAWWDDGAFSENYDNAWFKEDE